MGLMLTKFGCNMRTSFLAASLGWTGVVFSLLSLAGAFFLIFGPEPDNRYFDLEGGLSIQISLLWFSFSVRLITKIRAKDRDGVLKLIRLGCIVYCILRIIIAIASIIMSALLIAQSSDYRHSHPTEAWITLII